MFNPERERDKLAMDNFKQLFKSNVEDFKSNDPELMEILQKFIFWRYFFSRRTKYQRKRNHHSYMLNINPMFTPIKSPS